MQRSPLPAPADHLLLPACLPGTATPAHPQPWYICTDTWLQHALRHLHAPDPEYQAFVKDYEEGPRPAPTAQALLEAHEAAKAAEEAKGPVVTALMAFLQQKYEAGTSLGGRRGARGARSSGSGGGSRREPGGRLATVEEVRLKVRTRHISGPQLTRLG
jgi:hypothetical protein